MEEVREVRQVPPALRVPGASGKQGRQGGDVPGVPRRRNGRAEAVAVRALGFLAAALACALFALSLSENERWR